MVTPLLVIVTVLKEMVGCVKEVPAVAGSDVFSDAVSVAVVSEVRLFLVVVTVFKEKVGSVEVVPVVIELDVVEFLNQPIVLESVPVPSMYVVVAVCTSGVSTVKIVFTVGIPFDPVSVTVSEPIV